MGLILPEHYDPRLSVRETQEAIKYIRDTFQKEFGKEMNLERISAPLFVEKSSGLNDDLNGVERPVQFDIAGVPGETIEVVHSLAKWKRMALYKYGFQPGEGLYTNMNAIRRDEELDNLHSCYVDQWDWEKVIKKEERTVETLEATVRNIFKIIKHMEHEVWYKYPQAVKKLPEDIYFITSQELEDMYPDKTPKERENLITKEHGCVFLMNNYSGNETVNAGTGKELTIKALTELVAKIIGYSGEIRWDTTRPNGTPRKLLDVSKATALGWTYKTELENGIRLAYEDFLNNPMRAER